MLDRHALGLLKPAVEAAARTLAKRRITADQVTIAGFTCGMMAAVLVAFGWFGLALVLMLIARSLDNIDGTLARLTKVTDRGAFLDIALDFIFYAAFPLGFAIADPAANALAAAALLAAFVGTGTSFLAYAVIAEKRRLKSTAYPMKSIFYLGGLTEGTETILCFAAMCLWPSYFPLLAYGFATLCLFTILTRLWAGWKTFGNVGN